VFVYCHPHFDCYEVASYSFTDATELNRIYVACGLVFDIIKETAGMRLVNSQRSDLYTRALLNCGGEYLVSAVEAEKRGLEPLPAIFLRRFDGECMFITSSASIVTVLAS
jgi:hypothetical protein